MAHTDQLTGKIHIAAAINNNRFSAIGEASGDAKTGRFRVKLHYSDLPKQWHPLLYIDMKESLLFVREEEGGKNFLTLTGGIYSSSGTIDLGQGHLVRCTSEVRMVDEQAFTVHYVLSGTADLGTLASIDSFEETMVPLSSGNIASLGIARGKTQEGFSADIIFSTRYTFASQFRLGRPQVRRIDVRPELDGSTFSATGTTFVKLLPRIIEEGGPYIGNLFA